MKKKQHATQLSQIKQLELRIKEKRRQIEKMAEQNRESRGKLDKTKTLTERIRQYESR